MAAPADLEDATDVTDATPDEATDATPEPADPPAEAAAADPTDAARMVRLEQLGFPPTVQGQLRLRCQGVPESAKQRLINAGAELTDDPNAPVEAWIVSTRLSPEDLRAVSEELGGRVGRTVVLAHTGAERLAADLVRAGADAVVGEGNEEALLGLVDTTQTPSALLASFERRFGGGPSTNSRGLDPGTGLTDRRGFERRIGTLGDADEVPRVAYLKVVSDRWSSPTPDAIVSVQRRRLATALAHVAQAAGAELYSTGNGEFGLVGTSLSPHDTERIGQRLIETTETFRERGLPLRLVIGHAGPESAHDTEELLDLARRAVEVAAVDGARQVLGAEDLALGVSVTTELEAVVRLLDQVESFLPEGHGHGERVGNIAAQLARHRGSSPAAVARLQLSGHLHDVGRAGLPAAAVGGPGDLTGELLEAWRTFPTRSAELLQLTAGSAVADGVRSQRERWDGNGFPDGTRGSEIPESSRLIAVAHAIDEILCAERNLGPAALSTRLQARTDTELDPEMVALAVNHLPGLLAARG